MVRALRNAISAVFTNCSSFVGGYKILSSSRKIVFGGLRPRLRLRSELEFGLGLSSSKRRSCLLDDELDFSLVGVSKGSNLSPPIPFASEGSFLQGFEPQ